eukprot:CAMPEP_0172662570 /NCGR_PEP_ID=MMETSP1074-20121228/5433_1 /TAXON_ID=2916 /ORGANISM="Ceratium fusus, Strain PA161109" /LENGTH=797 /DNA_ID=CAMNT_0013478495 /DNA_START=45 /DNA_END=2435 /DNA_ORIENTATION=+
MTTEEVNLPTLRRLLADVTRKADQAQARVFATIDAKHAEFISASDQVGDLRGALEILRSDVNKAAGQLRTASGNGGDPVQSAACTQQDGTLVAKLRLAVAEHGEFQAELDSLGASSRVLKTMLEAHRQLGELDRLSDAGRYSKAAELTLEIAVSLQTISAPKHETEPGLVQAAKKSFYQRRRLLTDRLDSALLHMVQLHGRSVAAHQRHESGAAEATSVQQVWEAMHVLDMRSRRVEQLAEQLLRVVLQPLLDTARRLPAGQVIKAKVTGDKAHECIVWAWDTAQESRILEERVLNANDHSAGGSAGKEQKRRPSARDVLPVLESLFAFVQEHLSGASSDVYSLFGKRLWPATSSCLLRHFDTCDADSSESLETFESLMQSTGFVATREKTLSRHIREHRRSLGELRRTTMLAEARGWLMQGDTPLVSVCDATEPGSVTQLLAKLPSKQATPHKSNLTAATSADLGLDASFSEEFSQLLQQEGGILRLPTMNVSSATHRLVSLIRTLMDETVKLAGEGDAAAEDLNRLVRELCALFAILRPYAQKAQLRTSPHSCAIFLADCLYLVHALLILPYAYRKQLPSNKLNLSIFIDLVPQLRILGESHFLAMLRHMQEQIAVALGPCDLAAGGAQDRAYIAAEAALGSAVQRVKLAAQGMASSLPQQLLHETAGLLLGIVCQDLRGKLFKLQHATPDQVGYLSALLAFALNGGRQALAAVGMETPPEDAEQLVRSSIKIPSWGALAVAADLLGSGFSRFMEKRMLLLTTLRKEEVLKLMYLSWRDEFLPPEEAWEALNSDE